MMKKLITCAEVALFFILVWYSWNFFPTLMASYRGPRIAHYHEFSTLDHMSSGQIVSTIQDTRKFYKGRWVNHDHTLISNVKLHDWLEIALPEVEPGQYEVSLFLTKANDYGIIKVHFDQKDLQNSLDLYSHVITNSGKISLGVFEFKQARHHLKLEVVGHNPASRSPHFIFGIDGVSLDPIQ